MKDRVIAAVRNHGNKLAAIGMGALFSAGVLSATGQLDDVLEATGIIQESEPSKLVVDNAEDTSDTANQDSAEASSTSDEELQQLEQMAQESDESLDPQYETMGC